MVNVRGFWGTTVGSRTLGLMENEGITCSEACTFHPSKIGWPIARELKAFRKVEGAGKLKFHTRAEQLLGIRIPLSNVSRHIANHYPDPEMVDTTEEDLSKKPSDVEILDSIVLSGFRNSKNWKPTIRDTLEAMKLKASMTGNSAFDDLISLFDVDDESKEPEAEVAVLSESERTTEDSEDLEAPLAG